MISKKFDIDETPIRKLRRCTYCVLPETMPFIEFDKNGVCNYCRSYKKRQYIGEAAVQQMAEKIRKPQEAFKRWVCHDILPSIHKTGAYLAPNLPLEKLQKIIEAIGEQYKMLIESNSVLRQQLEYAAQFIPKTKYGSTSLANGQRRTTIRRGANVAGNGRLISFRNPDEVGYQIDLFEEYLPQVIFTEAVNIISHSDIKQLGCQL